MSGATRASQTLERRSWLVVAGTIAITFALLVPLFAMASEEDAPLDPGGEVFDLRDDIADRFPPSIFEVIFLVEARAGDVISPEVLAELSRNIRELRAADAHGDLAAGDLDVQPYLADVVPPNAAQPIAGGYTLVDAVEDALAHDPSLGISLEEATEEQVKLALHLVLDDPRTSDFRDVLAIDAATERRTVSEGYAIDSWSSPALVLQIAADNEKLGGGLQEIVVGGDSEVLDRERLQRNMQEVLRGEEKTYRLWAVGVDANLQARDDGERAGPFIMLTVIAALAMVGITLRSYWAVALTGAGLGILMIWLKGGANLIGIQGGLVVDLIVPIAMVSLGVDFAIHAVRRYKEERSSGHQPRRALRIGFAGVLGALALAMLSGSIAFLANVTSPIQAVAEFGVAAALAVMTAFVVLGIVVPLVLMHVDEMLGETPPRPGIRGALWPILGGVGVAASSGAGVILLVALDELIGVLVIGASIALTVVLPFAVVRRKAARGGVHALAEQDAPAQPATPVKMRWMAFLVTRMGKYRRAVAVVTVMVTAAAVFFALRVEAGMDVREMFSHDSDLVVGLDKLEEHVPQHQREAAHLYIRGDLADPAALAAVRAVMERVGEHAHVLRGPDGEARFEPNIFDLLSALLESQPALEHLYTVTGVHVTDGSGNGLPDTREQLLVAYDYLVEHGVPLEQDAAAHDPSAVRQVLDHEPGASAEQVTLLSIPILGTRDPATVREAQREIGATLEMLAGTPAVSYAGVTGPAFTRQATLDATTQSLQRSFPLAAVGVFALLLLTMRSWRYALVTIIPIGLVAAWLYGLMGLMGFNLNIVTATIGAVSIGVGIDYAIHLTERFREELSRSEDAEQALDRAASGTGVALLTSAASSIVGFTVMAFAPMPLFASYGMLTALMIFLAVSASLLVLPALLLFVTPEPGKAPIRAAAPSTAEGRGTRRSPRFG